MPIMEKQLSIVIPSYNMEEYLDQCIGSMVNISEAGLQALEVICVNDGSKDRTSEIAHKYADRYPGTVRVIDKANGHYGSCVNAALKEANGRYFRIVDADDWVDSESLDELLGILPSIDSDAVLTNFNVCYEDRIEKVEYQGLSWDKETDLTNVEMPMHHWLGMHMLTWKTSLLREIGFKQTEGICYTDIQYASIPLLHTKTITPLNMVLYQYRLGREGQSMDNKSMYKNRHHFLKMLKDLFDVYSSIDSSNIGSEEIRNKFLGGPIVQMMIAYLWNERPSKHEANELRNFLDKVDRKYPHALDDMRGYKIWGIGVNELWMKKSVLAPVLLFAVRKYRKAKGII